VTALAGTRTIIGAEQRALRNRLKKRGTGRMIALAIALLLAVIFLGGPVFGIGVAGGQFLGTGFEVVLTAGFTALSVAMLLLGFPTVIASLFVGRDLLLLVLAPQRTYEIFAARILFAMTANGLIAILLMTLVLGLGVGAGAPLLYFVLAPILLVALVVVVTSMQAILMSLVLRWVPARLARDVAAGVAALTGAAFYLTWNLTLRSTFDRGSRPDISSLTPLSQRVDWFPSAWPGHALSALARGNSATGLLWAGATLALAALLATVAALLYERTLLAGLGVFGSTPSIWRRSARRAAPAPRTPVAVGAGSPLFAIARKDWLSYRRDIRRLSRLLPALLFTVGYAIALSRPTQFAGGFWANAFLVTFLSLFMSNVTASPSIPSERRGFQILRMAPLTMWQVLRAKVLLTLPPVGGFLVLFTVAVGFVGHSAPIEFVELILFAVWLATGFVAISVSAGGIDPRFDATDDRRAVGMAGSLGGLAASVAFGALSLGALALFVFGGADAAGSALMSGLPASPLIAAVLWAGGLAAAAGAVGIVYLLLWMANDRLGRFEDAIAET
jgi:putative ABC exporter